MRILEYTLIVFCLDRLDVSSEFNRIKYLLRDTNSIKFNNSSKTISCEGETVMFVSHKSNIDGVCCSDYRLSSRLSLKATAEELVDIRARGNRMRMGSRAMLSRKDVE